MAEGKLVEFVKDSYPHCKGDVVRLTDDELDKHKNSTYENYKAPESRADKAQEAEIVDGKDKTVPTNETAGKK